MATMRELIGLSGNTPMANPQMASIGNINPAQVQAQQVIDSSVSQFESGIKGLQNIALGAYEGTIDANKMAIADLNTQVNAGLQGIDKHYSDMEADGKALTSTDLKNKMEWKEKYINKVKDAGINLEGMDMTLYKENFLKPTLEYMHKERTDHATKFASLFRDETIAEHKKSNRCKWSRYKPRRCSYLYKISKKKSECLTQPIKYIWMLPLTLMLYGMRNTRMA